MCIFLFEMLIDRRCRLFSNKNGKDKFFQQAGNLPMQCVAKRENTTIIGATNACVTLNTVIQITTQRQRTHTEIDLFENGSQLKCCFPHTKHKQMLLCLLLLDKMSYFLCHSSQNNCNLESFYDEISRVVYCSRIPRINQHLKQTQRTVISQTFEQQM